MWTHADIPEPAKQMAADLANAEWELRGASPGRVKYGPELFGREATYDSQRALARLCARTIERDALLARMQEDMARIYGLLDTASWTDPSIGTVQTIAARYRVEADPLVHVDCSCTCADKCPQRRAGCESKCRIPVRQSALVELAKRGLELGTAK